MSDIKLGNLIAGEATRDAIHFAIAPMTSNETLYPSQHIGLVDGSTTEASSIAKPIGIVDPFLQHPVYPGQKFWMMLYQQTVTGMRHEWTHPAFNQETKHAQTAADVSDKAKSEIWLRNYAASHYDYTPDGERYEKLIQQLRENFLIYEGQDMHSRGDLDDELELKHHAEIVLGITINFDNPDFVFSCTC